jgi:predicted O-methyltransferase YrrM
MTPFRPGGPGKRAPGLGPGKPEKAPVNAFKRIPEGSFAGPHGKIVPDHPWLTPEAMGFLESILTPTSSVLETGAGGSTLWIAKRAGMVVTYEHDEKWYSTIRRELDRRGIRNVLLYLIPSYPTAGLTFDDEIFDVLLVDGRGRVQTIKTALRSVKRGGWILLDNSERTRYDSGKEILDAACSEKRIFKDGWEATAWKKK